MGTRGEVDRFFERWDEFLSGVSLFLLGWIGLSLVVAVVALVMRAVQVRDTEAPGSRGARRTGCTCPPRRNWHGWREAFMGTSVLARGCPILLHHPDFRRRHFTP